MRNLQIQKLEIARRNMGKIDDIISDAWDALLENDRQRIFKSDHMIGGVRFSFLDLIIADTTIKEKYLGQGVIDYFIKLGISSDLISQEQKIFAELVSAADKLQSLKIDSSKFRKCLEDLLESEIETRHNFDGLKEIVIKKDFTIEEQDIELLDKLKEKVHQTYSQEESATKNGEYKFSKNIRSCFDVIYNLALDKLPNRERQSQSTKTSSSPSPICGVAFSDQQQNYLG